MASKKMHPLLWVLAGAATAGVAAGAYKKWGPKSDGVGAFDDDTLDLAHDEGTTEEARQTAKQARAGARAARAQAREQRAHASQARAAADQAAKEAALLEQKASSAERYADHKLALADYDPSSLYS